MILPTDIWTLSRKLFVIFELKVLKILVFFQKALWDENTFYQVFLPVIVPRHNADQSFYRDFRENYLWEWKALPKIET